MLPENPAMASAILSGTERSSRKRLSILAMVSMFSLIGSPAVRKGCCGFLAMGCGLSAALGDKLGSIAIAFGNRLCFFSPLLRAVTGRVYMREFRSEQKNLRRVIYPDQHDHQRRGCAVCRADGRPAQVKADAELSQRKQKRCSRSPDPNITPFESHIGDIFISKGKQKRNGDE